MPKKVRGLKKPKKQSMGRCLLWRDASKFIETKYGIELDDYRGKFGKNKEIDEKIPYCNFWHWWTKSGDVHNGCFYYMAFDWLKNKETEEWIKEILRLFKKEFAPRSMEIKFWVDW